MMAPDERGRHEEVWLLLPWLANGRLTPAQRAQVEDHVRHCDECDKELALQHVMGGVLTEPDRVTYAPGPSFRKLMDRIDGDSRVRKTPQRRAQSSFRALVTRLDRVSLWRPPGLAWAASFLLLFGVTAMLATAYRWSEPAYRTHTDSPALTPNVLHIALDRSLTIGEVEEMLRTNGARIVEGPGSTGIFGVTPVGAVSGQTTATANRQLRSLSTRLRADSRVLWVQPLTDEETPADQRAPAAQEH
jgi:hypothetical protein